MGAGGARAGSEGRSMTPQVGRLARTVETYEIMCMCGYTAEWPAATLNASGGSRCPSCGRVFRVEWQEAHAGQ